MKTGSGQITVFVQGHPQPLADHQLLVDAIYIRSLAANTSTVYIGDQRVRADSGLEHGYAVPADEMLTLNGVDLNAVYLDGLAGDGIQYNWERDENGDSA